MSEYESRTQVSCNETGLSCESCTSQTAAELARTCTGLRGRMVAQLFVQLYPDPGCARMHANFAAVYKTASQGSAGPTIRDDWEDIPSRVLEAVA
jgi:hypothetical protein